MRQNIVKIMISFMSCRPNRRTAVDNYIYGHLQYTINIIIDYHIRNNALLKN